MSTSQTSSTVTPILMPEAGNTMEEGTVLGWLVREGERISVGDILCEIETDKATMEYESPAAGRLARIVAAEGDMVAVKQPIAYLADSDAELDAYLYVLEMTVTTSDDQATAKIDQAAGAHSTSAAAADPQRIANRGATYPASPAVRRLAREKGLDLTSFGKGSGPSGRILTNDLVGSPSAAATIPAAVDAGGTIRRPIPKMRRRIGERLVAAKQSIPHFYMRTTVLADELFDVFREKQGEGCSLNDLIVFACGKTLPQFPGFRSHVEGDEMVEESGAHIGIAVGLDDGLVVPVIRDVQQLTLAQLIRASKKVVEDARRGVVANVGCGVFTISNLGMFGVEEFSAIINPPESAILAVGAVREQVIVENGAMRPGRAMTLTLSADHRVVDGVMAAKFLAALKQILEHVRQHVAS